MRDKFLGDVEEETETGFREVTSDWDERQDLWRRLRTRLRNYWDGVRFVPIGDPRRIELHPSIYAIAVSPGLSNGTLIKCAVKRERSTSEGLQVSFHVLGFECTKAVTVSEGKSGQVGPGEALSFYIPIDAELQLVQLYLNDVPKESTGMVVTELVPRSKAAMSVEVPGSFPMATLDYDGVIREFAAQPVIDPDPITLSRKLERSCKLALTVPLASAAGDKVGLSVEMSGSWCVAHALSLPKGQRVILKQVREGSGALLTSA